VARVSRVRRPRRRWARRGRRVAARAPDDAGGRQPRGRLPAGSVAARRAERHAGRHRRLRRRGRRRRRVRHPATQHDAVLWLSGASYDVVFDVARSAIAALAPLASVAEETSSWPYQHDRDLTGFIDGTENPTLIEAPEIVLVPEGKPGAGGTILLLQKWEHG